MALLLIVVVACTSRDPASVKAESIRDGDELIKAQRYVEAAEAYQRAVATDPKDGHVRMKLAEAY